MTYKKWFIFFMASLASLLLTACNGGNTNQSLDDQQPERLSSHNELQQEQREHTNQEAADRLAKLATSVPNVNRAGAIVFGDYTIVGIDVDADLDRSRVGSIKYSVAEAIKHDPYGHYAFVIADGDVVERLNRMGEMISQGHPDDAIIEEIANLVGRYMPQIPAKDNQPRQQDREQSGEQDDQMRDIQEDQSNQNLQKRNNNEDQNQDRSL